MVLLHEFDNVAVVATTVTSTTTGIIQFQAKQRPRRPLVQVGVRFAYRWGVSGGSGRGSGASGRRASSNFRLTASLHKRPFASAANATSEPSVSQHAHRERYGMFALRNAQLTRHLFVVLVQCELIHTSII